MMQTGYSLDNARQFGWSSVSGDLHPARVEFLKQYLTGRTLLDAGCGGGAFVDFLTGAGFDVTGIDLHPEFLAVAQERGYRGRFVEGDLTRLPFPDKTFDCCYCFDVLEHIDDEAALKELARVTRERILLTVPRENDALAEYNLTYLHYLDKTHLRNYTDESLMRLAESVAPRHVEILPELPVAILQLVDAVTTLNRDEAQRSLEQMIALESLDPTLLKSRVRKITEEKPATPEIAQRGARSRVKAWAVKDEFVQDVFHAAYRDHLDRALDEAVSQGLNELQEALRVRVHERFDDFINGLLPQASYATFYTGLAAVIDL